MCIESGGANHGPHCRGSDPQPHDPGFTARRTRYEIWDLHNAVKDIRRELKSLREEQNSYSFTKAALVSAAVAAATVAALTFLKK